MSEIPLKYMDRREEGETALRQCQLVQLHLLHVFDAVCAKHGLMYFLGGGTLLGAMRHDGFIPWDDDVDVGMPLKDYKKFLKIAECDLPADVLLQRSEDIPERAMSFTKLRDAYSFYCEVGNAITTARQNGISIDIFPYHEVPSLGLWLETKLVFCTSRTWIGMRGFRNYGKRGWWQAFVGPWLALVLGAVNLGLRAIMKMLLLVFPAKNLFLDINSPFVVYYPKKAVFPLKKHVFEDGEFPIPQDPETVLASQYGDWRKLPPEDQREFHSTLILPFQSTGIEGTMKWNNG